MGYITTRDNTQLYVKDWGTGRPVILMHGWPLSADSWDDQALALANATEYGLAAFVQTGSLNTAIRMYEGLEFGIVAVNDWLPSTPEMPFGGMKASGLGREYG